MKHIFKFILVYLIILGSIFSLFYTTNSRTQNKLTSTQGEHAGLEYLKAIYNFSLSLAEYKNTLESSSDKSLQIERKKQMNEHMDALYLILKRYPQFKNKELSQKLLRLSEGKFKDNEYYDFLDDINHENYRIGDVSRLLFEEDREVYFLSSLATHYMPEFLVSLIIVHNKMEEFLHKEHLTDNQKKLFIVQNKLVHLSSEELEGIISLLKRTTQTQKLSNLISEINNNLSSLKSITYELDRWNQEELQVYLKNSTETILLAKELSNIHFNILESSLSQREVQLQEKILKNKLILLFLIIFISLLTYYFYRSYALNLKKDQEIKRVNKALDESVIYSRTDKNGIITHVSTALCELSGYSKEELLGKTHRLFRHPDTSDEVFKQMWSTILQKKEWEGELKNRRKDGSAYWIKIIISPDLDEQGRVTGYDAYREEISDKKALEQEKLKTQKALEFKSMFLSNMSHEIRTPLNGIIGFTHLALKSKLPTKEHTLIQKIESASQFLLGVINDILDITKIESGQMQIEQTAFNLQENIQNVKNLLSPQAEKKGISLNIEYINLHDLNVIGDPLRFSQVLTNLINNAIKFTSKGGVVVRLQQLDEQKYLCEVIDTGIGLKEEQKAKLFQDFTQADMSTSRKYGGTGLGLSISKKLVELMQGEISVTSSFSIGSTFSFTLTLPKADQVSLEKEEAPEIIQETLYALKGKHVLAAEDNKMNQMLLQMLLEESELTLDFADDGAIAVEKFKEHNYDLILMDIQMPNLNGYEATKAIRQLNTTIPIIALSANVMEDDLAKAKEAGMNDHIAKPIEVDKLNATLLKYLNT